MPMRTKRRRSANPAAVNANTKVGTVTKTKAKTKLMSGTKSFPLERLPLEVISQVALQAMNKPCVHYFSPIMRTSGSPPLCQFIRFECRTPKSDKSLWRVHQDIAAAIPGVQKILHRASFRPKCEAIGANDAVWDLDTDIMVLSFNLRLAPPRFDWEINEEIFVEDAKVPCNRFGICWKKQVCGDIRYNFFECLCRSQVHKDWVICPTELFNYICKLPDEMQTFYIFVKIFAKDMLHAKSITGVQGFMAAMKRTQRRSKNREIFHDADRDWVEITHQDASARLADARPWRARDRVLELLKKNDVDGKLAKKKVKVLVAAHAALAKSG